MMAGYFFPLGVTTHTFPSLLNVSPSVTQKFPSLSISIPMGLISPLATVVTVTDGGSFHFLQLVNKMKTEKKQMSHHVLFVGECKF